jgi:hypothetical protein
MDEAAPAAHDEDVEQALTYLRLLWGDDFEIGHDEHGYRAKPNAQAGHVIRAATADELGGKMNGWSAS